MKTVISMLCTLFLTVPTGATTHVVQFGGSSGFAYSPKNMTVLVGDTVKWTGDFSMHPLSSTSVPQGAATWHAASGSGFSYVVAVAGTYNYRCDVHVSSGMTGSFTANPSGVMIRVPVSSQQAGLQGVAFSPDLKTMYARILVRDPGAVRIELFNALGIPVMQPFDNILGAGTMTIPIHADRLPAGAYFLRLEQNGQRTVAAVRLAR